MNDVEVVDAAAARRRIDTILGIGKRIAAPVLLGGQADAELLAEEIVGDAHLVAIGVGAEREQRGVLPLPSEPADAAISPWSTSRTIAARPLMPSPIAIVGIGKRQDRFIGNGLDESGAKERNRNTARDDRRFRRNLHLAAVRGRGEQLEERLAVRRQRHRTSLRIALGGTNLGDGSSAADGRHAVADRAARAVERGAEPFLGGFDFEEVFEPEVGTLRDSRRRCPPAAPPMRGVCASMSSRRDRERQSPGRSRRDQQLHRAGSASTT